MRQPGRPFILRALRACVGVYVLLLVSPGIGQVAVHIGKNHELVKQQFRPVITRANLSTVRVFTKDRPQDVALGTLVGSGSYVLTASSGLDGDLFCQLVDGRQVHAERIASIDNLDVALLRLAATGLQPVVWSRGPLPKVGSLLATAGRGPDPVAIGVLSIPSSTTSHSWLVHDTILRPNDCGGPLVDLAGRVVGINIASNDRLTSRALFATTVLKALTQLAADHPEWPDLQTEPTDPSKQQIDAKQSPLHKLEARIRSAAKRATACTVGLQIGPIMGSGVILSTEGYVLTAAHVSHRAGLPVKIFLADGRTVSGKTLGANHANDIGLIQIDSPGPWPNALQLHSVSAKAGGWCVATGHPNGYHQSRPPVLRLGRILRADRDTIMTDCVLKQGDSGGPLFDLDGNLLGIHSRIGQHLAQNIHVSSQQSRADWNRLTDGNVWGRE
jgi:S1-C subfamily serine protease